MQTTQATHLTKPADAVVSTFGSAVPASARDDAEGPAASKVSPLVTGLVTTAGAIVLLIGLIMVAQTMAHRQARQRRAGRGKGPAGSARRKTKHTKLKTSELPTGGSARKQEDDDEDEEVEEEDDEILGDDDDSEAPKCVRGGRGDRPSEASKPVAKADDTPKTIGAQKPDDESTTTAEDDEATLMKRVHSLLDDLPPFAKGGQ